MTQVITSIVVETNEIKDQTILSMRRRNLDSFLKLLIPFWGFTLIYQTGLCVNADFEVVPLWNDSIDNQVSCRLSHNVADGNNRSTLTGDPNAICNIQVSISTQFHGVLIQVPGQIHPGISIYIERQAYFLTCQYMYSLITRGGALLRCNSKYKASNIATR